MNNKISLFLSLFSLIVSCATLAVCCPRDLNLEMDYISILVTVLSVLVTAILGLKIYEGVVFEKRIQDKMEKNKEELQSILTAKINKGTDKAFRCAASLSLAQLGNVHYHNNDSKTAIRSFLNALAIQVDTSPLDELKEECEFNTLYFLKNIIKRGVTLALYSYEEKIDMLKTAKKIGDKEIIEFVNKIIIINEHTTTQSPVRDNTSNIHGDNNVVVTGNNNTTNSTVQQDDDLKEKDNDSEDNSKDDDKKE